MPFNRIKNALKKQPSLQNFSNLDIAAHNWEYRVISHTLKFHFINRFKLIVKNLETLITSLEDGADSRGGKLSASRGV